MKSNKFINSLSLIPNFIGDKERQVEASYNEMFKQYFPAITISNPYKCDGYFECEINSKKTRILCEYKYDFDLKSKVARSQVLAQVCFYLKRFEKDGKPFPNVVFVGDVNECFVLHANDLLKWLDFEDIDWNGAASGAAANNPDFVLALANDDSRNAYVFNVDTNFNFEDVYNKICDYATNVTRLIRITEHNVDKVFDVFKKIIKEKNVSANDMVAYFFGCVCDPENCYLHPAKKNTLVCNGKQIHVAGDAFKAFMTHFSSSYSPKEKARLASISDRLIEDTNRRRKGEFYTPTVFVDYSHKMISEKFGEDWKEKYVVWDCAAGTKNLTRDYKFKELYSSTLENAELEISKQYNPEATAFQFDFLNDEMKRVSEGGKVPNELMDALEHDKPIIFYINPPYANAGGMNGEANGFNKTAVRISMLKDKISAGEIYAQFLYRICQIKKQYKLTNCSIALFCNPKFITGESFSEFRKLFLNEFEFDNGIIFQASNFADVSASWGITFNIWTTGETIDKFNFQHNVVSLKEDGISVDNVKNLYNLDNSAKFTSLIPKLKKTIEFPNWRKMPSACEDNIKVSEKYLGCIYQGMHNAGFSTLMYYKPGGFKYCIIPDNFNLLVQFFAISELKPISWLNDKDEFSEPNSNHPRYQEFINDSIIYMCIGGGYDTSLRNVQYHSKSWNIKNEFFWADSKLIEQLANDCNNDEVYNDAHTMAQSFVYQKMQNIKFSTEAQAVLDAANGLLEKSMKYRQLFDEEFPEMQINNADAGMYQIGKLCKKYLPDDWKKFVEVRKKLADKMRPMIYELGFLKK